MIGSMGLSWLLVFHVPSIRPCLVEDDVDPDLFKERFRATLGGVLYANAGVAGWRQFHELAVPELVAVTVCQLLATSYVRPTQAICTAASHPSHIAGSIGAPSAHFKPPTRNSISSSVLPWRCQTVSRNIRIAS